jgi:hypothetical protein
MDEEWESNLRGEEWERKLGAEERARKRDRRNKVLAVLIVIGLFVVVVGGWIAYMVVTGDTSGGGA